MGPRGAPLRGGTRGGSHRIPLRCGVGSLSAPCLLSLCPPRKIPQTAAEGRPSPPPSGSCSPCSCCSSTPAPAGTRCPRPPAFNPRPPPSCSLSLHLHLFPRPGGMGATPPLPPGLGAALPTAASKEELGCGQGPPNQDGVRPPPAAWTPKAPSGCPPPLQPPPSPFTYFFSLKILNQIFLHLVQPGERRCVSSVTKTRGIKGEIITHKKKNQTKNKKGRGVVLPVLLGVLMGMPPPGCRRTAEAASLRRGAQCGEPGVTFTGTGPSPWSPPSAHPLSFMCLGHRYWGEKERKKKKKRQKLYFFFFFSVLQITVKPFPSACPSSAWPLCPALQKKPRASQRDRAGRVSPDGSRCVSPNGMHHVSPDGKH